MVHHARFGQAIGELDVPFMNGVEGPPKHAVAWEVWVLHCG